MKIVKVFIAVSVCLMFTPHLDAQTSHGIVKEGEIIESGILEKPVRYTVYLPFDYNTSSRYYPVVYLLHGYTDNDTGWLQYGEINRIADKAIQSGEIPPMIIVMPDGGLTWYLNNYDGSVRYEDFFFDEFIPFIESEYRIRTRERFRGIAGLSMGGFGTLVYVLKHPGKFSACAALSAGIYTTEELVEYDDAKWEQRFKDVFGPGLLGEQRLTEHVLENNPLHIISNSNPDEFKKLNIYIDCGDDDFLYKGNSTLHILLSDLGISHEYRVRDGKHSWSYWRSGILDGLKFIGESFHLN
jgi:S-formylglutathione hydrolase FrmB